MKIKSFESVRNYKKIMLGTSHIWSTSHSSQQTSEPVYYIVDCRILKLLRKTLRSVSFGGLLQSDLSCDRGRQGIEVRSRSNLVEA